MLIAGPTASGKSATAMALAEECRRPDRPAWIVNADSMQVYDALRVITARPGADAEARVPHRLYGHVPAAERYSVGAWLADMEAVLRAAEAAGALVIAVGGTGLYFKALCEGIAAIPAVPAEVRRFWAQRAEANGPATLHAELAQRDPATAASLKPTDRQRILRALEVVDATGTGLSDWQTRRRETPLLAPDQAKRVVLEVDRTELYARIEARVDRMLAEGVLAEVRALLSRHLAPDLPAMKAIGVAAFAAHLRGDIPLAAAVADTKTETRRYAKRQITWLRRQMAEWPRLAA